MDDKYNVFNLQEGHKTLLVKYLSFFKSKQDKFSKEITSVVEDFTHDK